MVRRPKYFQPAREGRERWLISYTDILTLLLVLFVAMAAQSVGQSQASAVDTKPPASPQAQAPPAEPPAAPPAPPQSASHEALARAEEQLKQHGLDLRFEPQGLVISLPQAILFASGDDRINRSALPIISEIADVLRQLDNKVELAGHADSVPIHNRRFKNNWELSAARGLSLLNVLTTEFGIEESRLTVSSHGSYNPKSSNDTAGGRAENRRVEILILDQQ